MIKSALIGWQNMICNKYNDAYLILSLRKVNPHYTGNCVRIRRSSDNAQQDIGFVNNLVDAAAISSFVGSGHGYVVTWYDQSGNARNYSQSTTSRQPIIRTSGVTETTDGFVAIRFVHTNVSSLIRSNRFDCDGLRAFVVFRKTSASGENSVIFDISGTFDGNTVDKVGWSEGIQIGEPEVNPTTPLKYRTASRVSAVKAGSYSSVGSFIQGSGTTAIGYGSSTLYSYTGYIMEVVLCTKLSTRTYAAYFTSMRNFYGL